MPRYPQISSEGVGSLFLTGSEARVQPFAIANYDSVVIEDVVLPIMHGSLRGGLVLDVEGRKAKGNDFKRYVSQGLDTIPVGFTLNLFRDSSKNPVKDWRVEYEKIEDRLMPRQLDPRNAIRIYHPSFAGRGITQIIPTKEPILQPVAVDRWTVEVEGFDVRFVQSGPKGATKKVEQDQLRTSGLVPKAVVGPEQRARNRVGRSNTWK